MIRREYMPLVIVIGAMVVLNLLEGRFSDPVGFFVDELLLLPGIVIGLSFHEFAHGFVSYKLGDPTPKLQGRLSLNPVAHIDLFGFLCLLFAGFGWGKPVQIDPRYYKNRRRDELLVSLAGVIMNFLIAVVTAFIIHLLLGQTAFLYSSAGQIILTILQNIILINLVLMIFNLIPVPPLDGFGVLTQIFRLDRYDWYYPLYRNGMFILLALILFNVTDIILNPAINALYGWIVNAIIY